MNSSSDVRLSTANSDVSILKSENEELKKKIKNLEEQSMLNVKRKWWWNWLMFEFNEILGSWELYTF